jgi:hypothetical protein
MKFRQFSFGSLQIDDTTYEHDLIIDRGDVLKRKKKRSNQGKVHVPPLIHLHAVVYVTWLDLFATQVVLAATNRVKLHMRLGRWIMAYGVVVVIAGLIAVGQRLWDKTCNRRCVPCPTVAFRCTQGPCIFRAVLNRWWSLSGKARNSQATDDHGDHDFSVTSRQSNVLPGYASSHLEIHAGMATAYLSLDDS